MSYIIYVARERNVTYHIYVAIYVTNHIYGDIVIIIIIIILLKQDYKVQLANNKIQMAWLTSWLVVW